MTVRFRTGAEMADEPTERLVRESEAVLARLDYLARAAEGEGRALNASEQREHDALAAILDGLGDALDARRVVDRTGVVPPGGTGVRNSAGERPDPDDRQSRAGAWMRTSDGRPAAVPRGSRTADHPIVQREIARDTVGARIAETHGDIGRYLNAISTTSGAALVPQQWFGDIIDRARNLAAVLQAGAEIVPMDAKVLTIGRVTGDPTAAFRTESSAITPSDPTIDSITLTASTMSTLIQVSQEFLQDAPNAGQVIANVIAQAFAQQLDLVALYGGITTGAGPINLPVGPNPRGIASTLATTYASSVLGGVANGTTQTTGSYWNEIVDTIYTPRDFNEAPTSLIWNSKAARQYSKAYDTTGQPLQAPADVAALQRFVSNQVPSYTQGTMTSRATDVFVGDFSQLIIGQRLGLTVQPLVERYADNGQVGFVAAWRGDVALARGRAFAIYKALQGAV